MTLLNNIYNTFIENFQNIDILLLVRFFKSQKSMRRLLFLTLFVLIISWCNKNKLELSFQEYTNNFHKNFVIFQDFYKNFFYTWTNQTQFTLQINSENKNFDLSTDILSNWIFSIKNKQLALDNQIYLNFFDKKQKNKLELSWDISNKIDNKDFYIKFDKFLIDLWNWNYEWWLFHLIYEKLKNKWIFSEFSQENTFSSQIKDIFNIFQTLSDSFLFQNLWEIKYDWNNAYKISINTEKLEILNQKLTFYKIWEFEGLLIINQDWAISLKINKISLIWNQKIIVKWILNKDIIDLKLLLNESENRIVNFLLKKDKKWFNIKWSQLLNYQNEISLDLSIKNPEKEEKITNYIKWYLLINPSMIYWSNLEKDIKININFEQEIIPSKQKAIQLPQNYIYLKQLLWDSFSLKNLIWDQDL